MIGYISKKRMCFCELALGPLNWILFIRTSTFASYDYNVEVSLHSPNSWDTATYVVVVVIHHLKFNSYIVAFLF